MRNDGIPVAIMPFMKLMMPNSMPDMKETTTNKINMSIKLRKAFDLHRDLAISAHDMLRLIFVLLFYKRVSDSQTYDKTNIRIFVPEINSWSSMAATKPEQFFQVADSNIRNICAENKIIKHLAKLFDIKKYDKIVGQKDQGRLFELFSTLELSPIFLSDYDLAGIIEAFIGDIGSSVRNYTEYTTSSLLNRLVVKLLDPRDHEYFFVPSFGFGQIFLTVMQHIGQKNEQIIFRSDSLQLGGCESNKEIWGIAVLITLLVNIKLGYMENENYFSPEMHEILSGKYLQHQPSKEKQEKMGIELEKTRINSKLSKQKVKSFVNQADNETLYFLLKSLKAHIIESDVLFLHPPLPMRLPSNVSPYVMLEGHTLKVSTSNAELLYMVMALKHIKKEGRMAAVLPLSSLAQEGDIKKIWQVLCDNDYLEAIIQLPDRFNGQAIPRVLVLLNKRKPQIKKYRCAFIKVQETRDGADIPEDEIDRIHRVFEEFKARSNSDFVANLEDIQQNDYKLSPVYYLGGISAEIKKLTDANLGRRLDEVCDVIRGRARRPAYESEKTGVPFITTKDLAKDVTEPYLDLNDVILSSPGRFEEPLRRKCILVSLVGRDIKPTIYEPQDTGAGILAGHNIAIVIPNETLVDFEYLYYQLYTTLFRKQFDTLLRGAGIPNLSLQSLKSIIVSIPPLDIQRSLVSQQKSLLFQAENRRHQAALEKLKGVDKKQDAEFSIVSHLTHSIRPKLHIVKSPISSLIDFLTDKNLIAEILSIKLDGSKESVGEALGQAMQAIDQISDVLTSTRKLVTSEISRNDFRDINISSVFENEIIPLFLSKRFHIVFHCKGDCIISLHKESFVEAINNLIVNAEVHAFKEEIKNPEVRFDIHGKEGEVTIDYTNNGLDFPDDMTAEQFLAFREKSTGSPGEGLGGAWIGKFVDAHMGTFTIIRDKHSLHFRITIPRSYK